MTTSFMMTTMTMMMTMEKRSEGETAALEKYRQKSMRNDSWVAFLYTQCKLRRFNVERKKGKMDRGKRKILTPPLTSLPLYDFVGL